MKPLFSAPAFARRLNAAMHIRAISLRKAAGQMQVDPGTLHRVKGGTTPSIETYLRIVRWLDAVDAVFDRAIPKPD